MATPALGAGQLYGQRALTAELERLADAPVGERNHTLNRAAFRCYQLAGGGILDADDVTARFTATARGRPRGGRDPPHPALRLDDHPRAARDADGPVRRYHEPRAGSPCDTPARTVQ